MIKISEVVQNNRVVISLISINKAKQIIQGKNHNVTACIEQTILNHKIGAL